MDREAVGQQCAIYFYIYEGIYMTSGAQTRDSQFTEVDWRLPRCSQQF
jgi:hypothetical protein